MAHAGDRPSYIRSWMSWPLAAQVFTGFVLLYVAVYLIRLVMGIGPNLLMRSLGASPDFRAFVGATLNYGVGIAAYIVLPAVALRRVLRVDPWPRFFPFQAGWWRHLLIGLLLVGVVLSLLFMAEVGAGWLSITSWNWTTLSAIGWLRVAWVGLLINAGVAIGEETIFRGYLLAGLRAAWGRWTALIGMSIIFGLFHLPAYFSDGLQAGSLTLAIALASAFGLLFGWAYLQTGSLWLPVALHFSWNFIEGDLFNLSADSSNPNLIGAVTTSTLAPTIVVMLETLALAVIALGPILWLRRPRT